MVGLLLVAAWFSLLRPSSLGGRQAYVVVDGTSMEPTYHDGDLVLIRKEAEYAIGDIITYRVGGAFDDPTRVIHRLVGHAEDGKLLTQGDNRTGLDPWRPDVDDVIGRAVLHVPKAGRAATAAAQPEVLAAFGGAAVVAGGKRRRRRRPPVQASERTQQAPDRAVVSQGVLDQGAPESARPDARAPRWLRHTEPRWAFIGLLLSLLLAMPVLLGLWSVTQATTSTVRIDQVGTLTHGLVFDYRFTGAPSPVYPTGVVTAAEQSSGVRVPAEPLFSKLLERLELAIDFRAEQTGAEEFTSTYGIDVVLTMPEGFTRVISTSSPTAFSGGATEVVSVDLRDVARQVAEIAALTGVGGDKYTITVSPTLAVNARRGRHIERLTRSVRSVLLRWRDHHGGTVERPRRHEGPGAFRYRNRRAFGLGCSPWKRPPLGACLED